MLSNIYNFRRPTEAVEGTLDANSKRLCFEFPNGSAAGVQIPAAINVAKYLPEDRNNMEDFESPRKNKFQYYIISRCPDDEETRELDYKYYCNMYGIDLQEYKDNQTHKNAEFFDRSVKHKDLLVMCNLNRSNSIKDPESYFAFYRENLALAFDTSEVHKQYLNKANMYSFKHMSCFQTLCKFREFKVDSPQLSVPEELQKAYEKVLQHKCCRKFNSRNFVGILHGSLHQFRRRCEKNNSEFSVLTFKPATDVSTLFDEEFENSMEIEFGREIKVRDCSVAVRYNRAETLEKMNLASTNLRVGKIGSPSEVSNADGLSGLFVFNGFVARLDPEGKSVYLTYDKLVSFIPNSCVD